MVKHTVTTFQFPKAPTGTQWRVYHFLSQRRWNVTREWLDREKVSARQRGDFQSKIDSLERGGPEMVAGFIAGPLKNRTDLFKAKIKGNKGQVQLRPRLCYGPLREYEFTFLVGAIERGGKDDPPTCDDIAIAHRDVLMADHSRRIREPIDKPIDRSAPFVVS